jgi:hypothetical protein
LLEARSETESAEKAFERLLARKPKARRSKRRGISSQPLA